MMSSIITLKGPAFLAVLWGSFIAAKLLGWAIQRLLTRGSGDLGQAKDYSVTELGFLRGGPRERPSKRALSPGLSRVGSSSPRTGRLSVLKKM